MSDFSAQLGDVIQVRLLQAVRRGVHLGDQCFAFTEIDVVEQPFADQLLRPGLQARPLVPQGKLVLDVGLHVLHIAAVQHAGQSQCRPLLEGAVLHVGPLPVRRSICHTISPPRKRQNTAVRNLAYRLDKVSASSQNRKYRKGL